MMASEGVAPFFDPPDIATLPTAKYSCSEYAAVTARIIVAGQAQYWILS
jgi:hypothetical protein